MPTSEDLPGPVKAFFVLRPARFEVSDLPKPGYSIGGLSMSQTVSPTSTAAHLGCRQSARPRHVAMGLVQDGFPAVIADNVVAFDFREDYRIWKAPSVRAASA